MLLKIAIKRIKQTIGQMSFFCPNKRRFGQLHIAKYKHSLQELQCLQNRLIHVQFRFLIKNLIYNSAAISSTSDNRSRKMSTKRVAQMFA